MPSTQSELSPELGWGFWGGVLVITLFFGVVGVWSFFAALESAAIAPGMVVVTGERKKIQHLEGGVVREIMVQDGSFVKAGDPLIVLDATQAESTLESLRMHHVTAKAVEARLSAEREGLDNVVFPDWMRQMTDDVRVQAIIGSQQRIFQAARENRESRKQAMMRRIDQFKEEIVGLEAKVRAARKQERFVSQELIMIREGVKSGIEPETRALSLERNLADIEGNIANARAQNAVVEQKIAEAHLHFQEEETNRLEKLAREFKDVLVEGNDVTERMRGAEDIVKRMVIRSPVSGTVMDMHIFTDGGVVSPGRPLMDIVPKDVELQVKVRVDPNDIDAVQVGQSARVRVTAFNQRNTQAFSGEVVNVSADRLEDERTLAPYYTARVRFLPNQKEQKVNEIQPGMSAEVLIITGKKTLMGYLIKPLLRSVERAFLEE